LGKKKLVAHLKLGKNAFEFVSIQLEVKPVKITY